MNLSDYYEEICKEPILTKEEEVRLITIYKDPKSTENEKTKARDRVIKANLRFVFKQAKYFSKNEPKLFEELISAGNEGLLVGLEKYDLAEGKRFLSYAGWWVKQRILKEMSRVRIVALPIWKQQLASKLAKIMGSSEKVSIEELRKEFPKVSEKDIKELAGTRYLTYYLEDIKDSLAESEDSFDSDTHIDNKKVYETVKSLPSPYKEILSYSFALDDTKELSNSQIAKKLLLTKDQVRELKKIALEMMRDKLSAD